MITQIKNRNMLGVVLLYIFLLPIYPAYIYFKFGAELSRECNYNGTRSSVLHPVVALILSLITFGIYTIIYPYKQSKALEELGYKVGVNTYSPVVMLFLAIFANPVATILNIHSGSMVAAASIHNSSAQIEII